MAPFQWVLPSKSLSTKLPNCFIFEISIEFMERKETQPKLFYLSSRLNRLWTFSLETPGHLHSCPLQKSSGPWNYHPGHRSPWTASSVQPQPTSWEHRGHRGLALKVLLSQHRGTLSWPEPVLQSLGIFSLSPLTTGLLQVDLTIFHNQDMEIT